MADEALVLSAQVTDHFSQPIRDMQRSLRALTDANKAAHVEGVARPRAPAAKRRRPPY
jgi:hypothetical protein